MDDYSKAIEEKPNFSLAYYRRGMCKIKLYKKVSGELDVAKAKKLGLKLTI